MCGISGASLSPNENVNARRIAKAMLLSIESRGRDATGFAFREASGAYQVHKDNVDATTFVKRNLCLPKGARTFIMHTRFATQGDPLWNENNHPIATSNIVGVHNGCINNDWSLFSKIDDLVFGKARDFKTQTLRIAEVDSEAIFANLAYGEATTTKALEAVRGSAAVAWMDTNDALDTLHLARLSSSPLIIGETKGGSLLFASTAEAVEAGASAGGLEIETMREIPEGFYMKVVNGEYVEVEEFEPAKPVYYGARSVVTRIGSPHHGITDRMGAGTEQWDDWSDYGIQGATYYPRRDETIARHARNAKDFMDEVLDEQEMTENDRRIADEEFAADLDDALENGDITREEYEEWWKLNTTSLDAQLDYDDRSDNRRIDTASQAAFVEFATAPTLNSYLLSHIDHKVEVPTESEYLCGSNNQKRSAAIGAWLNGIEYNVNAVAENLKADIRPGCTVTTDLDGVEVYGHLVTSPVTFPHGDYLLRIYVPSKRRQGGYEALFAARAYWEFEVVAVVPDKKALEAPRVKVESF